MTTDPNKIIQSLWIGDKLSLIEQLCIQSFLQNGHDFHLYAYHDIKDIPQGTIIMDANSIIPSKQIFDENSKSIVDIFDWFRYQLIYNKGGWWVDMDVICLKYLDIKEDYCFAYDLQARAVQDPITNGIFKSPQKAEYLADLLEYINLHPKPSIGKNEYGTELFNAALENYDSKGFVHPAESFFPVGWHDVYKFVSKQEPFITDQTYTVALFSSFWSEGRLNREATYHTDSFYEQLKRRYIMLK